MNAIFEKAGGRSLAGVLLAVCALAAAALEAAAAMPPGVPGIPGIPGVAGVAGVAAAAAAHGPGPQVHAPAPHAQSAATAGDRLLLAQRQQPRVSLDEAVSKVRARYEGRVIRAETRYGGDGRPVHHVKLLSPDGRVRTIRVDGLTGRIR